MADFSATPREGFWYTAVKGDYLSRLASIAYGNGLLWSKIFGANTLRSGNPDLIYPGEVLWIPEREPTLQKTEADASRYTNEPKNSYKFLLQGMEIDVSSIRLQRSFDSIFDSWVVEIPWIPGKNIRIDNRTRRGSFTDSQLYLGNQLMATGRMYNVKNRLTTSGSSKILECFSSTVDLVDSKMPPQYAREWGGATLKTVATDILGKTGFGVVFDSSLNNLQNVPETGSQFDWVGIEKIESYSAFLIRLAASRGILVANDEHGRVVFQRANSKNKPVGTLSDTDIQGFVSGQSSTGAQGSTTWEASFSGREMFHQYAVIAQGGDAADTTSVSTDASVPTGRTMTYEGEDIDQPSVANAAAWRRSKQLAKAWTIPIPVSSWYNPQGDLWTPGQIVTVKSAYLEIPNGANFLIRTTEHVLDEGGMVCHLTVCPPQCFTGETLPAEFS